MSVETTLREGIIEFNDKQEATGRFPLTSIESNMLVQILRSSLAEQMGSIREELESAASQANLQTQNELDWATDIIVAALRMDNKDSISLTDEEIRKYAAGFILKIDREDGVTELELILDNDNR